MIDQTQSADIKIYQYDETFLQVSAEDSVLRELSDFLTFDVPGAKFMPSFKYKQWDGKKRLLRWQNSTTYKGLLDYIKTDFAAERNYTIWEDDELHTFKNPTFSIDKFLKHLNLAFVPYDFQRAAIEHLIKESRGTCVSATGSGKSLIIYAVIRYYLHILPKNKKIILIVPTIGLIKQLSKEFKDYSPNFDISAHIHEIHDGKQIPADKRLVISTWQSIFRLPSAWFGQFGCALVDEAHGCDAKSLTGVFEKCPSIPYRFGFTGTLRDTLASRLLIEGLLGKAYVASRTHELRDRGIVSNFKIKPLILEHKTPLKDVKAAILKYTYQEEIDYVVNCQLRNQFIAKLAKNCIDKNPTSNVLILTDYHDKKPHIRLIQEEFLKLGVDPSKLLIATGNVDKEDRENIRTICEASGGNFILATTGVFSTGISIKNLQYLIFAINGKALIKLLQSIGRLLRLDGKENMAIIFDIVDDLSFGTSKKNFGFRHFFERLKIYSQEKFVFEIKKLPL